VVGVILEVEPIPKKAKLKKLKVNVGDEENPLTIVTNAKNVEEGRRVVIATVGAYLGDPDDENIVAKTQVGGVTSQGMLCDAPMLGWKGGAKGNPVKIPDSLPIGSIPPEERPPNPKAIKE